MADRITELSLEAVMGERFGRYSKYIIQERALPDIRDGLKPVQRRILFAMNQDGNTYDHPYRKSAKSVGNVMGNFHPHGDSSIYEAMVRLSQNWKVREPLIDMNGNNGSIDNDPAAAMRYTEARLSKIAGEMMADLGQDTVDMVLNFDDTTYEPTVLPSRIPSLLINGATGISAGYATEIPPHNLKEINAALIYLLDHPEAPQSALMRYIKGPDFPTGGIIQGLDGIKKAYKTGRGKIVVRAKTAISELKGGKKKIEITELPYEVVKSNLVSKIDAIRLNKEVAGISEVRDESDREGMSIVIELNKDTNANGILTYLFKKTDLQIAYNFNMVAIHDQRPVHVSLKQALEAFIAFRKEVVLKRSAYELAKAQARQHIVEGLIRMLSILDEVVATIRASKNRKDATQNLIARFDFTQPQAEAIVTLQLYRLTNTDVTQLEEEFAALTEKINHLTEVMNEEMALKAVIRDEITAITQKYQSARRSQIEAEVEDLVIDKAVTIAEEDVQVLVSRNGYYKRASIRSYKASDKDNGLADDDLPVFEGQLNTTQHLFMFTNKGSVIYRPVHELPDSRWKDTGEHFSQELSNWRTEEYVIKVVPINTLEQGGAFTIVTNDGFIKQTTLSDMLPKAYKKKTSMAIKLKTDDSYVVNADYFETVGQQDVLLLSQHGVGLRFAVKSIPEIGARTAGVKAMDLRNEDTIKAAVFVTNEAQRVAIMADNGAFKYMPVSEITRSKRANKGLLIFTQKKTVAYHVATATILNIEDTALEILTTRWQKQELQLSDYKPSQRVGNGQYVVDVKKYGEPWRVQPLTIAKTK
ncbi:DNA topoisomerase IV subunit A [Leuconostoc citreum]|uniref:DNA topoisomerase 4 subunit A n=1 Tax=Leuconostoc citreum (strain KM20) TaxID=349519 RepID=B1MZI1_LEUCK|nr:DNA topoisomerase IV subunit A [Leuconostoc citreum]ACA82933.1 DNA topoisomerase IV, A subunit [Leuconostoc citreum KM20]MCJ2166832.1 DNA topoisomerase IV subunit A [Leuconostoc citreum]MCT3058512.1 DNA topoisomerase IV subunit A [Leuconostoc citreum]MCT3072061.1 DNA topoisomerase IV subunit A [Leuconostoc citreum]MCT3073221.1 DNA topoisomerase IV subunit A [Leuconostoc citreum]